MNFLSVIEKKRDGGVLSSSQIQAMVSGCVAGEIPDYQMAALLMAVFFRGMTDEERRVLTLAMRDSGETLKFPADPRPLADKHSTGGVGDKVSLPLAPLLACLGCRVPMISGRGLGITGGTLDKLESIPGFDTALPAERMVQIVQATGCVICGQTDRMVPADKKIYALRDVTGTVPSIALITASILSKKLAENLDALVLDVKFGSAAFMQTKDQARELAAAMVSLGGQCGVNTRALLTGMDTPLGRAAGNWLEIRETVDCLEGRGPADLRELVVECAAHLLVQTGKAASLEPARAQAGQCLASGLPRRKWDEMLSAQGADVEAFRRKLDRGHAAAVVREFKSSRSGFVVRCDARILGGMIRSLGGGRLVQGAPVLHDVGVDQLAKPGDAVQTGDVLARLHAASDGDADAAWPELERAFAVADAPPPQPPVHETVC